MTSCSLVSVYQCFGWTYYFHFQWKVKVNVSLDLIKHRGMEMRYDSAILDLGSRWRWVVCFTILPLYSWGMDSRYPLDRRLGGSQSLYGGCGEDKNLFQLPGIKPQFLGRPARNIVAISTELSRLHIRRQERQRKSPPQMLCIVNHARLILRNSRAIRISLNRHWVRQETSFCHTEQWIRRS
jgi:hypothetical protein